MTKRLKVVDLFCGAGGASEALKRTLLQLGIPYELLAVNHSKVAIETHRLNHPEAVHLCESIERVDPRTKLFTDPLTGRTIKNTGRWHLLIAGPECTHHSTARGGRPINDQSRATAWHVPKWAQEQYIDNVLIENVPEFREWGPIGVNGRPLKSRKGQTYAAFINALRSLGYKVDDRILNAADYGDPTTRRRLFVIARRGNKAIQWPAPSHSKDGGRNLFGRTKKWRAAREVIDWSLTGQSIFDRKRPLSLKTMARILAGLERFGGAELKPFLIVLRNHAGARSLEQPLPALAASGQHMALCEPFVLQQQSGGVARPVAEPLPTIATDGAQMLVEPFLIPHYGERPGQPPRTHSVDEPVPTIPATGDGKFEVVQPFIVEYHSEKAVEAPRVRSVEDPLPTATTENRFALAEPSFIASYYGTQNISPVSAPLPTVTAKDRFALVMPVVNGKALDIRLRMLKPHELARAMSFGNDYKFAGNQGEQVRQIGNAWPCRLGAALITAIVEDYAARKTDKRLEAIA